MATKTKLISLIAMALVTLAVMIFGVFAATSQTITMQGVVNINVDDQTLYLRDVRMQTDMAESPKSVPGFRKGYINGDFQLDLSSHGLTASTTGTFVLYFDIVNLIISGQTSEYIVEADWVGGPVSGASFSIDHDTRMIDEGTVTPANLTDSTPLSGSVALEVNVTSGTSFDLSKIAITVREPQQITTDLMFTTDDVTMTAEVKGNGLSGTSIVIPRSISKHSDGTFWEGNDYTVTKIGDTAFAGYGLRSVKIPDSVTVIGSNAFNSNGLTSITFPDSVTEIHGGSFDSCVGLKTVIIGSSVKFIDGSAFTGCSGVTKIYIKSPHVAASLTGGGMSMAMAMPAVFCETVKQPSTSSLTLCRRLPSGSRRTTHKAQRLTGTRRTQKTLDETGN